MGVIQSINNVRLFDFYGAAPGGVVSIDTFDTPALLPEWTTLLGTPANNVGALQATLHGLGLLVSATDSFVYYEEVPL